MSGSRTKEEIILVLSRSQTRKGKFERLGLASALSRPSENSRANRFFTENGVQTTITIV
jgi:hypothetical protein